MISNLFWRPKCHLQFDLKKKKSNVLSQVNFTVFHRFLQVWGQRSINKQPLPQCYLQGVFITHKQRDVFHVVGMLVISEEDSCLTRLVLKMYYTHGTWTIGGRMRFPSAHSTARIRPWSAWPTLNHPLVNIAYLIMWVFWWVFDKYSV